MAGLQKEIWLATLIEQFEANISFLQHSTDMSFAVENDKINLAEAGLLPEVYINNTTFPIPIVDRTDIPLELPLNFYDTQNTRLRNSDQYELAYDKRSSVVRGHAVALRQKIAAHAMYNWAPSASNAYNKVVNLGSNTFDFDVIIDLANWYKNFDVNDGSIHLSLCPDHEAWLQKADSKLYKAIYQSGQAEIYGIKLHSYSKNPRYDGDGAKKAFGSANLSTDKQSSVAWIDTEVMSAFGTVDMFDNQKDAKERADLIGFQQRALAMSIRNKYSCAILK